MHNIFLGIEEVSIVLCLVSVVALAVQKTCEEQKYIVLASASALISNLGYLVELMSKDYAMTLVSMKMQCIGNFYCVFLLFRFVITFYKKKIPKKVLWSIFLIITARCIFACASGIEELGILSRIYYYNIELIPVKDVFVTYYQTGAAYHLWVAFDFGLLVYCFVVILQKSMKMTKAERKGILLISYGAAILVILFVLFLMGVFAPYEIMPACLCFVCALITWVLVRYGYFGIQYFAQSDMLQRMKQGYIMVDRYYNLLGYNQLATKLFPELAAIERGEKIDNVDSVMCLFQTGADTEHDIQAEDCYYKVQTASIIDEMEIKGYSVWIHDVTDMHAYTEELIQMKEEADNSNKEKSNFLANMSHEIRTPLNVIIGSTELILRERASDTVLESASTIKQAGKSLLGIINDILDFSKIEAGKMDITPVEYSIDAMVSDLVNMVIVRLGKKQLDFLVDIDVNLPKYFYGDDMRIKQIVINLLTNAVKFTESGYIKLSIKCLEQTDAEHMMLRFLVEDSGIGIKKENRDKLFDSFSRFDTAKNRAVEGTGLGLAISLMLARNMGGKLQVESEYGKGSCFSVDIPQRICKRNSVEPKLFYHKALIVETDKQFIPIYENALDKMGIEYTITDSEEQFFDELNRSYDILFVNKNVYDSPLVIGLKTDKIVMMDKQESANRHNEEDIFVMKQVLGIKLRSILNKTYSKELRANAKAIEQKFIAPAAKVLIVDDNAVNLRIAQGLLKPFEIQVDVVDNGLQAITKIEENDYDIVFMDHMMPGMDGIETTARIRSHVGEKYQNLVIVALTANAVNGAKNIFLTSGMQDFLSKPIEMNKMIQVLKKWIPEDKILDKDESREGIIKGLDINQGLANYADDENQYHMALNIYGVMSERFMEEINNNIKDKNIPGIERIVQTFARESNKIGAVRFAKFLNKYEEACKNMDEKFVFNNYSFLQKNYEELLRNLKQFDMKK